MTPKQARETLARAYNFYHGRASLAPRTRAESTARIVAAWRAYCHIPPGPDKAEGRRAMVHMCEMEQYNREPEMRAWSNHVAMPHHNPSPDKTQPEAVNVWLRLIERSYRSGITHLDRRHYWRQAYRAHLAEAK